MIHRKAEAWAITNEVVISKTFLDVRVDATGPRIFLQKLQDDPWNTPLKHNLNAALAGYIA